MASDDIARARLELAQEAHRLRVRMALDARADRERAHIARELERAERARLARARDARQERESIQRAEMARAALAIRQAQAEARIGARVLAQEGRDARAIERVRKLDVRDAQRRGRLAGRATPIAAALRARSMGEAALVIPFSIAFTIFGIMLACLSVFLKKRGTGFRRR